MLKTRTKAIALLSSLLIVIGVIGAVVAAVQIYQSRTSAGNQVLPEFSPLMTENRPGTASPSPGAVVYKPYPKTGEVIGKISIPALRQTLPIIEGTGDAELKRGVGHFVGSVLPGIQDNSVLAGHRDSVFSQLGKLSLGDHLIVRTEAGEFTYRVTRLRIVEADDRTVIVPTTRAVLTLSTCYPFRFIGNAPQRYIVSANLIKSVRSISTY